MSNFLQELEKASIERLGESIEVDKVEYIKPKPLVKTPPIQLPIIQPSKPNSIVDFYAEAILHKDDLRSRHPSPSVRIDIPTESVNVLEEEYTDISPEEHPEESIDVSTFMEASKELKKVGELMSKSLDTRPIPYKHKIIRNSNGQITEIVSTPQINN